MICIVIEHMCYLANLYSSYLCKSMSNTCIKNIVLAEFFNFENEKYFM